MDTQKTKRPKIIFMGIATKNTFICGTVLAIRPRATLASSSAAITGAPVLIATTNIFDDNSIRCSNKELLKWKLNGGINLKLSTIARKNQ